MAQQAEAARQREEAERQKAIDEARARMEREQQEEMQAQAQAIMVMQGGGTPGPSTAVVGPTLTACERCTIHLQEPEGCMVSERGKARACLPCQKACKACVWPLGAGGAGAATGSRTEASEEEGGEDCNEHVAQRRGEVQEGAHDDRGSVEDGDLDAVPLCLFIQGKGEGG